MVVQLLNQTLPLPHTKWLGIAADDPDWGQSVGQWFNVHHKDKASNRTGTTFMPNQT